MSSITPPLKSSPAQNFDQTKPSRGFVKQASIWVRGESILAAHWRKKANESPQISTIESPFHFIFLLKFLVPLLLPARWAYQLIFKVHQHWMFWQVRGKAVPRLPLMIIGSLSSGGSGKTSVCLAVANRFRQRGLRVAILCYDVSPKRFWPKGFWSNKRVLRPVDPRKAWRPSLDSDEALLLARKTDCPVYLTRNRWKAWNVLDQLNTKLKENVNRFDVLLSDDGYQDRRLQAAKHILILDATLPKPQDLLPQGPYRELLPAFLENSLKNAITAQSMSPFMLRIEHSGALLNGAAAFPASCISKEHGQGISQENAQENTQGIFSGTCRRETIWPPECYTRPLVSVILLCSLGYWQGFYESALAAKIEVLGVLLGKNHRAVSIATLSQVSRENPRSIFVCTEKDWVRYQFLSTKLPLYFVTQNVQLDETTLSWVESCVSGPLK